MGPLAAAAEDLFVALAKNLHISDKSDSVSRIRPTRQISIAAIYSSAQVIDSA